MKFLAYPQVDGVIVGWVWKSRNGAIDDEQSPGICIQKNGFPIAVEVRRPRRRARWLLDPADDALELTAIVSLADGRAVALKLDRVKG